MLQDEKHTYGNSSFLGYSETLWCPESIGAFKPEFDS